MITCSRIINILEKKGYRVVTSFDRPDRCIVLFAHPSIKGDDVRYLSGIFYIKDENKIEVTARRKVKDFKELYLDYCCENGEMMCRPHVWMDEKILSIEAKFHENILEKFKRLLDDIY